MRGPAPALAGQLRIARVAMMVVVTGTTAFGFGAAPARIAAAAASAGLLSLGCFLLDHLFDAVKDRKAGHAGNPFAAGALTVAAGGVLAAVLLAASAVPAFFIGLPALAAAAAVVLVVVGLGLGPLDGPILRAFSLGALQGLYALLGAFAAGPPRAAAWLTALFLLFAMTGGRILGDVRDSGNDARAGTRTIPLRYGMRAAIAFLFVFESLAWLAGAGMSVLGGLGRGWLWCLAAIAAAGTVINVFFALSPTPRRADIANRLSLGLLGGLYCVGMVLSRLVP